ncbi:MAG: hypothetical protein VX603_17590 [Gemmatimonadota bacterium]|nr:hypothetical protein [Gemmatimonadota bacterium]MEE2994976.1 hypothetical protein [Gemmatimonadota bacterium]
MQRTYATHNQEGIERANHTAVDISTTPDAVHQCLIVRYGNAAHSIPMAGQVFCRGMDHHISTHAQGLK